MPYQQRFIKVKKLHPDAVIPIKQKPGDAGFDLYSVEDAIIEPGKTAIIPTGIAVALPDFPLMELQIRMRSGSALKTPLIIPNAPGTIDAGYRGEIGIIVRNCGPKCFTVKKGERIAQAVPVLLPQTEFFEVGELPDSERGAGGYGSTGTDLK